MNDNEELSCEHCSEEATTIEVFDGRELCLCDGCYDELPIDEYTGERVTEIVACVNGYDIGQTTYDNEVGTCDWSGDDCLQEYLMSVGNDYIHPDYEDDVRSCWDCGSNGHVDDMMWSDHLGEYFCECCYEDNHRYGDRWNGRYAKLTPVGYSAYPIRNYVGIEFEAEDTGGIEAEEIREKIAIAKDDGSLNGTGTEYCTHILTGNDIRETVEGMCKAMADNGHTFGSNVGWHFHYDMSNIRGGKRIKNLVRKVLSFQDLVVSTNNYENGFGYFSGMMRSYATTYGPRQAEDLRRWATDYKDKRTLRSFRDLGRYMFVNLQPLTRNENRTVEVRLYQPCQTGKMGIGRGNDTLGQDYLGFIRFWDEFIRKAMYRPLKLRFANADGLYNMKEFADQFSGPTQKWLMSNSTGTFRRN